MNLWILMILGFLAFFLTHTLFLSQVPGLHYDEAWAANFSATLASGKLGFPLEAMSPYTVPWSHWVTAFFFKWLHPSLLIDRLSGVFLSAAGVFLICLSFIHENKTRAAVIFVWIAAFSMALISNHRFCIEITTFQVFCFGLLTYGLTAKKGWLVFVSIFLGITSHILFIAPALATWLTLRLHTQTYSNTQRGWTLATCVFLIPFLLRILFKIPEKDKSVALIILNGILIGDALFPQLGNSLIRFFKKPILGLFGLFSIPCFAFLIFFGEGHWTAQINHGWIVHPEWIGWAWALLLGCTIPLLWKSRPLNRPFYSWLFWTTILIGLIATKPAPRYFETPLLGLLMVISSTLAQLPRRNAGVVMGLFILISSIQLKLNYFDPGLQKIGREEYFKFYLPRDNSSDFLPKQLLADYLGQQGCTLQNIKSGDTRILEALHFLSLGDWPVHTQKVCPFQDLVVQRKSQANTPLPHQTRLAEVGPFVLDGNSTAEVNP